MKNIKTLCIKGPEDEGSDVVYPQVEGIIETNLYHMLSEDALKAGDNATTNYWFFGMNGKRIKEQRPILKGGWEKGRKDIEGCIARAQVGFTSTSDVWEEKYPTRIKKAAVLFYDLANVHPFQHCNKRTAWATAILFLDRNSFRDFDVYFADRTEEIVQVTRDSQNKGGIKAVLSLPQFTEWLEGLEKDYYKMKSQKSKPRLLAKEYGEEEIIISDKRTKEILRRNKKLWQGMSKY